MHLDIRSHLEPPVCALEVSGELDLATADTLRDVIDLQVSRGNTRIYLDLKRVSFMDSSGVHVLAWAQARAHARGGSLTLAAVSPPVTRIMRVVGAAALRSLPRLKPTHIVEGREARVHREPPGPDRWRNRSRTYPGIAAAMAEQWGAA